MQMGKHTNISWTTSTWNPWQGCKKVSAGCQNCYMYRDKKRYGQDPSVVVRSKPPTFNKPLHWKEPAKVFVCSWSDFFIEEADEWRGEAWEIIKKCPHLIFQILTKRPERIKQCLPEDWGEEYSNVWLGVTAENQEMADLRIPLLLEIPATIYFASCEPLLERIDIRQYLCYNPINDKYKKGRRESLHSGSSRRDGSRRPGSRMENREKRMGSLESMRPNKQMQEGSGRTLSSKWLPTSQSNDRGETPQCFSSPSSMVAFSGKDPGRIGDESQKRKKGRQSINKFRDSNSSTERTTCGENSQSRSLCEPEGGKELYGKIDRARGNGNTPKAQQEKGVIKNNSTGLRNHVSSSIQDSTGGSMVGISWCISGGESGAGNRHMHPDWARSIRDQCRTCGVPFFMKQMSGNTKSKREAIPEDLMVREFPK